MKMIIGEIILLLIMAIITVMFAVNGWWISSLVIGLCVAISVAIIIRPDWFPEDKPERKSPYWGRDC